MGDAANKMDRSCFTGPGVSGEEDAGQMRTGGPDCGAGSFETLGHQAVGFRRCRRSFDGFQNAVQLSGDALPSGAVLEDIPWVKRKLAKILTKEHAQKSIVEDAGSAGLVQLLTDAAVQRTQRKSGTTRGQRLFGAGHRAACRRRRGRHRGMLNRSAAGDDAADGWFHQCQRSGWKNCVGFWHKAVLAAAFEEKVEPAAGL